MNAISPSLLTGSEGEELLAASRATLGHLLLDRSEPSEKPLQTRLNDPGMAFVTLKRGAQLRGCIGSLRSDSSLYRTVIECALSAAEDPRFERLSGEELADLTIVVSVLGEFRRITAPAEIEVGRHGLLIEKAGRRGLLLPEVATEMNLEPAAFLDLVCKKAYLPQGAWKENALVQTFTSQVFTSQAR